MGHATSAMTVEAPSWRLSVASSRLAEPEDRLAVV